LTDRAILVHGTTGGPEHFAAQHELAGDFDLILFARRGYGDRRTLAGPPGSNSKLGWPVDVPDLLELMTETGGAHLVGHSYGGPVVALAASERPDLVRSLVLVETALGPVVADDPEMAPLMERERKLFERRLTMDAREFSIEWMAATMGAPRQVVESWVRNWTDEFAAAADLSRREAWYGDAPVDLKTLAALGVPKVVVIGARRPPFGPNSQDRTERISRSLAERLGARLQVFGESTHFPPSEQPEAFNQLLRDTWRRGGSAFEHLNGRPAIC